MKIDFTGKTVLVTGATRGIGQQVAIDFESLGATMILTGTKAEEIHRLNQHAKRKKTRRKYFCVDFSCRDSLGSFVSQLNGYPRIDILVNNAGVNYLDLIKDAKAKNWDRMMDVNLRAPYFLMKTVALKMKKYRYGRIVNISSVFGHVTRQRRSMYTTTKAAIIGMTKTAAVEFAEVNVLVNAVSPGFIMTDLTKKNLSKKECKDLTQQVPLRRFGSSKEISSLILFLCSDANTYMTGQNLIIDGGFTSV